MIGGKKYVTPRLLMEVPYKVQEFLWETMDKLKKEELPLEQLQIFELVPVKLKSGEEKQLIIYRQEKMNDMKYFTISVNKPIEKNIFAVNDATSCTMFLSSEYGDIKQIKS